MAVSFISTASAASNTVAMPTHAAGDMIVAFAFRDGDITAPTIPAGWLGRYSPVGQNTCSMSFAFKIAASASETTGTWTNATGISVAVYRKGASETWTTPAAFVNSGTGTSIDYSALYYFGPTEVRSEANTELWWVRMAGHRAGTDLLGSTPAGWTARGGANTETRIIDSGGPSYGLDADVGDELQTVNASSGWWTTVVRLEVWNGSGIVCMGAEAGPNDASFTMPLHDAGDLIIGYANRTASATPPSLPAGYTDLANGGADLFSTRLASKVAVSSLEAAPVFTDATFQVVAVYRNSMGSWNTIDVPITNNGNDTTIDNTQMYVPPIPNQTTGFVRFESADTAWGYTVPGWDSRSAWYTTPAISVRDALNVLTDVASIGADSYAITSAPWRVNTVRIGFNPNKYENIPFTDETVPSGVAGCYVSLTGGGGAGGGGATRGGTGTGNGGGGGGGGAHVSRVWVPAVSLGSTFSLSRGIGGAGVGQGTTGNAGGVSTFSSGSITITANGGAGGLSAATPTGGSGGTFSVSGGLTYDVAANGESGGPGSTTQAAGTAGTASATNAGAGGGGGGSNKSNAYAGGAGGDSLTQLGGAAGPANSGAGGTATDSALGLGGAGGGGGGGGAGGGANGRDGGTAGTAGGGGGGGGGKEGLSGFGGNSGAGAAGYTMIEWVPISGQFFTAYDFF